MGGDILFLGKSFFSFFEKNDLADLRFAAVYIRLRVWKWRPFPPTQPVAHARGVEKM